MTRHFTAGLLVGAATLVLPALTVGASGDHPDITPDHVEENVALGGHFEVEKTVHTPEIPPNPAIVFLADTTGSMGPALGNVQANATAIMNTVVGAQPTAVFAAAQYRDIGSAPLYSLDQGLTANVAAVQLAISGWSAGGGGDTPEAQLNALTQVAGLPFAANSTPIVVWFGDASGHDPSNGATLASTIAALTGAGVTVIAIDVVSGFGDGLDNTGQATAIATATSGVFLTAPAPDQVAQAILDGLSNLPVVVSMVSDCADPITTDFAPDSVLVISGEDVSFIESIWVADDAEPGEYHCRDWALINGEPMTDDAGNLIVEEKWITVVAATCDPTENPHGNRQPQAPANGGQGQNQDGFYEVGSTSGEAVFVLDDGSGTVFGPFPSGTEIKWTEDDDAVPIAKPMGGNNGSGGGQATDTDWHIIGNGDALVVYVDAFDNLTFAACLVPPPPK